ncbi:MAG: tyrosine-type recombinase/integrase [Verrucomicrobiota bacterium]
MGSLARTRASAPAAGLPAFRPPRRGELAALRLEALDASRGLLTVRQGKGKKDRVVPIGERAQKWTQRYLEEAGRG